MSAQHADPNSAAARLAKFQRIFPRAWLPRDIYSRGDVIQVHFPPDLQELCDLQITLAHESGRIYAEANAMLDEERATVALRKALNAPDGRYQARIRPKPGEYYGATPYEVALPLYVLNGEVSRSYYGDAESRRQEALTAAIRRGPDLFSELARLAQGQPPRAAPLIAASKSEQPRQLLALLLAIGAFRRRLPAALAATLNGTLRRRDFGAGAAPLAIACRRLAGALYKQQDRAEAETGAWLRALAAGGFDFSALPDDLMALAALVALDEDFGELAAALLDKLLFTLALHPTDFARDRRLSPLSPVTRLLWGLGNWNHDNAAAVFLACARAYEVPALIQAIAIQSQAGLSAIDQHRGAAGMARRQSYRHAECSLVSLNQRWLAELGHIRVSPESPCHALRQQAGRLACQGASELYFPSYEFDNWALVDNWAFARRGDGYLAMHRAGGFTLARSGQRRGRLLQAQGDGGWLTVCLGAADADGAFEDFRQRLQSGQPPAVAAPAIPPARHYSSPYCQADFEEPQLQIRYDEYVMQLDLQPLEEAGT